MGVIVTPVARAEVASGLGKAGRCECGLVWLSPRIGGCGALKSTGVLVQLDVGWTHPKAKSGFLAGLCAGGGAGTMGPGRAGTAATWALGLTLALGLEPLSSPPYPKRRHPLRLTAGPRRRLLDPCQKSDFAIPSGPGSLTMWQTCVEGSPCAGCWMARRGPGPQACGRGSCPPPGSPFLCPVGRWGSHGPCACWVLWGPGGQWVWHTVGARGSEALPETRALRFRVTRCERECGGLTIAGCISPDAWSVSRGTGVCHARVRGEHRTTGLRGG